LIVALPQRPAKSGVDVKLQAVEKKSVDTVLGVVKLASGGGKAISGETALVAVLEIGKGVIDGVAVPVIVLAAIENCTGAPLGEIESRLRVTEGFAVKDEAGSLARPTLPPSMTLLMK
jgi:hypothetical protein